MFGLEDAFIEAQSSLPLFIFEMFVTVYLLMVQGIMAEKFLMPSLNNLSKFYQLS